MTWRFGDLPISDIGLRGHHTPDRCLLENHVRVVTRADLDGLASTLILGRHEPIDEVVLVHPQDITGRTLQIRGDDILANLPFHPDCGRWFAHHILGESDERPESDDFPGLYRQADSAAELVWEHYGREPDLAPLVRETSRLDSARLTELDVLQPRSYVLLGFTLDAATGLGDDAENRAYFLRCLEWLRDMPVEEVLVQEEVRRRIVRMFEHNEEFCRTVVKASLLCGNVIFTDLRPLDDTPAGNRFLVYTLFPEANVSVRAQWGPSGDHYTLHVGHSILNRTCRTSVGELMARYGGGGHQGAGSTPLPLDAGERRIFEIIGILQRNG